MYLLLNRKVGIPVTHYTVIMQCLCFPTASHESSSQWLPAQCFHQQTEILIQQQSYWQPKSTEMPVMMTNQSGNILQISSDELLVEVTDIHVIICKLTHMLTKLHTGTCLSIIGWVVRLPAGLQPTLSTFANRLHSALTSLFKTQLSDCVKLEQIVILSKEKFWKTKAPSCSFPKGSLKLLLRRSGIFFVTVLIFLEQTAPPVNNIIH